MVSAHYVGDGGRAFRLCTMSRLSSLELLLITQLISLKEDSVKLLHLVDMT